MYIFYGYNLTLMVVPFMNFLANKKASTFCAGFRDLLSNYPCVHLKIRFLKGWRDRTSVLRKLF